MMCLQILQRSGFGMLLLGGTLLLLTAIPLIEAPSASAAAAAKKSKQSITAAEATARRYAEAMGAGNTVAVGQLDFACQYSLVAAAPHGITRYPADSDPVYDSCRQRLQNAHAPTVSELMSAWRSCGLVMANWFFSART